MTCLDRLAKVTALAGLGLAAAAAAADAATPVSSVSASPDVTVRLGSGATADSADEDVAVDNLLGMVMLAPLGALPGASDVSAYELLSNGDQLLCFDTAVELPGPVTASVGDVVRYTGAGYSIAFDASANGVPEGARCDAVSVDGSGDLVLSFDTTVELPGSVVARDEDLVRLDAPSTYTLLFDGSAEGVPESADVDGAHLLANGNIAVSLDVTASVGGVDASDEDVLEYDPGATSWSLAFDGSAQDPDWVPADTDAVALPEPALPLLLSAGLAGLALIGRGRWQP